MGYIGYTEFQEVTCDAFSVEVAVRRYIGYSTVTLVTVVGKSVYIQLHRVTCGYIVTCGYLQLHGVTCGYIELQVVTYSYTGLHVVTYSYTGLHVVT